MIECTGKITQFLFRTDDYSVCVFQTEDKQTIRITGNLYGIEKGNDLTIKGEWFTHNKYGKQLQVKEWKRPIPKTRDQIISFLSSGLVKGVGKKRAVEIVDKLGIDAISKIKTDEEKALNGIKGIGKRTAKGIVESIKETFEVQEIINQLSNYGITANLTLKLYKKYGAETVQVIQKNPYKLTEVDGLGFLKTDEIARKIGILPTSGFRITACVQYVLNKICNEKGHSFIEEEELIEETLKALNHNIEPEQQVQEQELTQLVYSLENKLLIIEDGNVYPKYIFEYEERLAQKLSKMRGSWGGEAMPSLDKHIKEYQTKNKIILAEKQREAIRRLMEEQILILTGGPGTGKTTVVKAMIDIYKKMHPKGEVRLSAPTGRASRRLEESTGYEAMTIHRMIGYRRGEIPEFNADNKLSGDLIVIDEFSMTDLQIAYWLINALEHNAKILFIGDTDQLPSVGVGNVLNDLIKSGLPTVQLTEIFRQAEESQIITNAHRINKGQSLVIDQNKKDFYFIKQSDPLAINHFIIKSAVRFRELGYSLEDILILSPMKKGDVGITVLNESLRDALNPRHSSKNELELGKRIFRVGDKVLQTKNNLDKNVFNGELGIITSITKEVNKDNETVDVMYCKFDNKSVKYYRDDCNELELGFAITIHKSQGGEAPVVIMPITTSHYKMLARNLYYTGITRAKERVVLIGTEKAMNIAIRNNQIAKRNSKLDQRIIAHTQHAQRYINHNQIAKHS